MPIVLAIGSAVTYFIAKRCTSSAGRFADEYFHKIRKVIPPNWKVIPPTYIEGLV
jgi:hypothetical protein